MVMRWVECWGEQIYWEVGTDMYTLVIFKTDNDLVIAQGTLLNILLYSTRNSTQYYLNGKRI